MRASFMTMLLILQASLCAAVALGQQPLLRNVPLEPPTRVVAPAVVTTETVHVPAAVARETTAVNPAALAEVSVAGQILRTKQIDLRPAGDKLIAALIDTGDGQRQVVDLGPAANWKNTPLHAGDQMAVRGPLITLGDTRVVVATEAHVGSSVVFITRVAPPTTAMEVVAAPTGYPLAEQVQKFDARIDSLKTVALRGVPDQHTVAETTTRRGEVVVVDLGPPAALWRADLKPQDWIRIEGQQMDVNNRPVILALQINKNGVPFLIDRSAVRTAASVLAP